MRLLNFAVGLALAVAGVADAAPHAASTPADDPTVSLARKALDDYLRDYPSARFRNVLRIVATNPDGASFCGEVNATNRSGGYTGWRSFAVRVSPVAPSTSSAVVADDPDNTLAVVRLCNLANATDARDYSDVLTARP